MAFLPLPPRCPPGLPLLRVVGGGSSWSAFFGGFRRRTDSALIFLTWGYVRHMYVRS